MRIVAISDTHRQQPLLPPGDLLIHAGDWSGRGGKEDTVEFLKWMTAIEPFYPNGVVAVPGNHDIFVETNTRLARKLFKDAGIRLLINRYVEVGGVGIFGTPYSLPFYDWAFMRPEKESAAALAGVQVTTQVLVSHGPPKGILDWVPRTGDPDGENTGSFALRDTIDRVQPKVCIFGHIHEGAQTTPVKRGATDCYNVAYGYYGEKHLTPTIIDI